MNVCFEVIQRQDNFQRKSGLFQWDSSRRAGYHFNLNRASRKRDHRCTIANALMGRARKNF